MYEFILKKNCKNVYNIYKDNKRIRDENDFCVKIDEENKSVAFFNACLHMLYQNGGISIEKY